MAAATAFVPGIVRNRTSIFMNYRKQARIERGLNNGRRGAVIELQEVDIGGGSQRAGLLTGTSTGQQQQQPSAAATATATGAVQLAVGPAWLAATDDLTASLELVRRKIGELTRLHATQFLVDVDVVDGARDEQQAVEIATAELSRLLGDAQRRVKLLGRAAATAASPEEAQVVHNAQAAYAAQLGELTRGFRQAQQAYLSKVRKRSERFRDSFSPATSPAGGAGAGVDDDEGAFDDYEDRGFTDDQLAQLHRSEATVSQRDKQLRRIHRSIIELSDIVKDLAMLVADQGTILDRIDYNIEHTAETTEQGLQELHKASDSQKRARTKMCVLILLILIVIGVIVLVFRFLGIF